MRLCDIGSKTKYWHQGMLVLCTLLLSRVNSDSERDFFFSKRLLKKQGINIDESTFKALLAINDY